MNKILLTYFVVCLEFALQVHAQTYLGNYTGYQKSGSSVVVQADTSAVKISFYTDDIARIDFLPSPAAVPESSFVVIQSPSPDIHFTIQESDSLLLIQTHSRP